MPVIIDPKEDVESYHTLFGFSTKNGLASKSLNFVYVIVMIVAIAFAFHALSLILTGWNVGLIFLASLSVVGLPYCIKIIMYGRDVFEYKYAVLCIIISLLPTVFDFVGFYSETSIKSELQSTKFKVLEKVNYFDKEARKSINKQLIDLEKTANIEKASAEQVYINSQKEVVLKSNDALKNIDVEFNSQIKTLEKKINDVDQAFIDETVGVRGKITSGVAGVGPRAKELEADVRKVKADAELSSKELEANKDKETSNAQTRLLLDQKELESTKIREIDRIQKEYIVKKTQLEQGIMAIDNLVTVEDGDSSVLLKVTKASTFEELADISIQLNGAINVVSSKLNVEPQFIKFDTDNVINLSFSALLRGDITALVCFGLALLLEIVDTIIVYMVRGVKSKHKKRPETSINNIRETIKYNL